MCGFIKRDAPAAALNAYLNPLGLGHLFDASGSNAEPELFYPAFGHAAGRQIKKLIIQQDSQKNAVNATWWFDCNEQSGELIVGDRTTFNARNLVSPYWKGAIRHHRAIVVATAVGESKLIAGKKHHYLMQSDQPILLGAVYRPFPNNLFSTAVITRDSHPRFEPYHDKAFPLFLPADKDFLDLWLSDAEESDPDIAHLLEQPRIFNDLRVTRVKTFMDGAPIGVADHLAPDLR